MQLRRSSSALLRFVSVRLAPVLLLGIATLFIPVTAQAERVEDLPKPTNWVADFAHVLTPETTERIDALCGQLSHSKANAQIEVVTIKSLDGDDIDDWTNRLEEKWQIGKKGSDRGLLMVFAIQDRKRRIEVGLGLQGILTDAKVGDIGRSVVPALRAGNYDQAVTGGVVQIANIISADAGVSMQDMQEQQPQQQIVHRERSHISLLGLLFRIGFIVLILLFLGARGLFGFGLGMLFGGGGRWGGGGGWGGGDGGGGSWGGGGGGFDGGGGGSSDGGGASGSW
jgi:uncharacterized protein